MRVITVFKNQCKKKLFIGTYCIGVELNQLFPKFVEVVVGEKIEKRYKSSDEFNVSSLHFAQTNAFSKQKLNYNRRVNYRH